MLNQRLENRVCQRPFASAVFDSMWIPALMNPLICIQERQKKRKETSLGQNNTSPRITWHLSETWSYYDCCHSRGIGSAGKELAGEREAMLQSEVITTGSLCALVETDLDGNQSESFEDVVRSLYTAPSGGTELRPAHTVHSTNRKSNYCISTQYFNEFSSVLFIPHYFTM